MPKVENDITVILRLYKLCRQNGALPYLGGVLDQPSWIMSAFDVIDSVKSDFVQAQRESAEAADALGAMGRGNA